MKDKFWIIIIIIALFRFVNIGFENIYPWDEAMYAIRAKSIVYFGNWIDQTPYSPGGLYIGHIPPFSIWMTAIAFKLFGISNFSVRLSSAIFGALTVILIYYFAKRLWNRRTALFASMILGLNMLFTHFSRQGQLDIICAFFISLSLFLYLYYKKTGQRIRLILSGISFGLALLSKSLVGFYVPIILGFYSLYLLMTKRAKFSVLFYDFATIFSIGVTMALPWYIYMTIAHGRAFINYVFFFNIIKRATIGVENNVRVLGPLFFVNQLSVRMPFGLTLAIYGIIKTFGHTKNYEAKKRFMLFWFFVVFIMITSFKTKLVTYMIPSLIPLSIFAGYTLSEISYAKIRKKDLYLIIFFTLLNIFWAMDYDLRQQIKIIIKSLMNFTFPQFSLIIPSIKVLLSASAIIGLVYIRQKVRKQDRIAENFLIVIVIFGLTVACLYFDFIFLPSEYDWHILKIRDMYYEEKSEHLVAIGKYRNEQIPYYFDNAGIDAWKPSIDYIRIKKWDHRPIPKKSLVIVEKFGYDEAILPYLQQHFLRRMENQRYIIFVSH